METCPHCGAKLGALHDAYCPECREALTPQAHPPHLGSATGPTPAGEADPNRYFRIVHAENGAELHATDLWRREDRFQMWIFTALFCLMAVILGTMASVRGNSNNADLLWLFCVLFLAVPAITWIWVLASRTPRDREPLTVRDGELRHGERVICSVGDITAVRLRWDGRDDYDDDRFTLEVTTRGGPVSLPSPYFGYVMSRARATLLARDLGIVLCRPVADEIAR